MHFIHDLKALSKTLQPNRAGKLFNPKYLRQLWGCPAACQSNIICCCEMCALRYSKKARGDARECRASWGILLGNVQCDPCCHLGTAPGLSQLPEGVQGHPGDNPRQSLEVKDLRGQWDPFLGQPSRAACPPASLELPHSAAVPRQHPLLVGNFLGPVLFQGNTYLAAHVFRTTSQQGWKQHFSQRVFLHYVMR